MLLICGSRDSVLSRVTPKIWRLSEIRILLPVNVIADGHVVHCKRLDVPKYATADLLGLSSSPLSQNQYCNESTQPCKLSKAVANGTVILVKICISSAYWWYSTLWLVIKRPIGLTYRIFAMHCFTSAATLWLRCRDDKVQYSVACVCILSIYPPHFAIYKLTLSLSIFVTTFVTI